MAKNEKRTLTDNEKRILIVEKRIRRLENMIREDMERERESEKKSLVDRFRDR